MPKRSTQRPQDRDWHVPLAETLKWIEKGEKLVADWSRQNGPTAERMAESMHKRVTKLRAEGDKLWELYQTEQKAKKARKK